MTVVAKTTAVRLWRGKTQILQGIDWQIGSGEHWVVFGPNGAGKTSLINMLAAQLYPSAGTVQILGETLGRVEVAEMRTRVGYLSAGLDRLIPPEEKVRKVILTAAWGMTASWREDYEVQDLDRAQALMQMFQVESLQERDFGTLSQGEKQRVLVARALMIDPELLILDEPAAALDLGGRELLLEGLTELSRDPASPAMVMVTHHLEEIPVGFTHALLLKQGRVACSGPLREVLTGENLSAVYQLPLQVTWEEGRVHAQLKNPAERNS